MGAKPKRFNIKRFDSIIDREFAININLTYKSDDRVNLIFMKIFQNILFTFKTC